MIFDQKCTNLTFAGEKNLQIVKYLCKKVKLSQSFFRNISNIYS